jgi:hypothetical protein
MKAQDCISAGESAVVLFTRGPHFKRKSDGSGSTGNWKLDPGRTFDRVVIYHRIPKTMAGEIYVGDFIKTSPSREEERYIIHFSNLRLKGKTHLNWFQFGRGHQDPVQYF